MSEGRSTAVVFRLFKRWRDEGEFQADKGGIRAGCGPIVSEGSKEDDMDQGIYSGNGTTEKILIVDDDSTTVKILTHFLEREKYIVTSSLSGAEGLEKAFREKPRLILLDIMIPDLNGFQFLSGLKKDKDLASVPVILLSMLTQESDILKGLEIGAVDYVTKPFSPAIMLAKIKKYMRQEK